ncbi:MAG: PKD domain-containing protein [Cytophagales bacterium]|nr:PKD domain-containing protein [Cytophagales bacterium]
MTDIELLVELPDNFTSLQSAEFLYPANAGSGASYQPAAYTVLPSGLLRFHITGTDILNGGLPGFQTSQNNIRLRLELNTVCGFDPGLPVRYTVNGTTNCGDPRSFADQRKMPINGVTLDEIDVQLSIVDNNNGTNQVSVTMTNNGTAASSDGEFRIFLDPNVQFGEIVQSDFTGPPTETITTWGKELIWPMPAAFLAVGQTKSIVINTSIPLGSGVSGELVYFARTSMFASANCGPDVCPVNATTGEGNDFIMVPDNAACGAGPDQVICTPSTTMAAANVNGRWTQESGPSEARFSDVTSPLSQVSFGTPGQYRLAWTVVDGSCTPASDDVIIHYNAGFDVTVLPTDRRPVKELTRGRFYGPLGGVDSGLNYPVEGGGAFSGLGIDHKANKVYVNAGDNGIWILDRNTNHGAIISHTTNIPGDNYNQYNPKALFIDETSRVLYAAGQPLGTNAGALWRYDLLTGEGKAFYPSMLLPGGGDPFPNGIGADIKRFGNELYLSLADPGGSLPGNGLYIYDEAVQSGRLLNSQSTGVGGLYPVQGDPMPADLCLSSTLHSYQGKTYLYVSIMDHGIWEWNITDNIGRMLTPTSTARGGQYAVSGDPSTLLEPYGLRMIGNVLVGSSKANGIWLYDMVTNTGKSLRVNTTAPVGSYASVGDPMPSNNGGGLAYDPITRSLFAGISGATLDQGLTGGHGDGGIWQYNLSTGKSRRHIFGDVGFQMNEYSTFPVVFDRFERAIYGVPTVELPTSGLMAFDLRRGIHACSGEMVTIRANVTGISGVTYQWNENGVPIAGATNATYSTSTPGYYTVTVSQGACVVESQGFIISAPRFDNLVITPGGSTEVCEGGTTLLSVPAGYTRYQWFLDGNPVQDSNTNVLTVQANEPGIYTVEASTFEGCQMMASNSVTVSPSSLSLGSTTSFDDLRGRGSIDLAVNGGVLPYTYQWSQGLPAQEDHFNTLLPGAYNVTVTDAVGCTATMNSIIVGLDECPFDLSASITPDNGNGNGAIDITVTGTSGPYTYAWSDGLPSQQDQAGLLAGIYRVVVTDAQGCSEDLFVALGSDCQDVVSYRVLSADVSCYGANDGLIAFSVVDGNPLYGFALYEAATETEVTQDVIKLRFLDNSVLFAGLEPMEYIVSVRQRTCEFFDVFDYNGITIGEPAPLSATFLTQGDNGTGNGSIDLTVTGGTAPYTYNWSGGLPATEDPTGVSTEVYSVTVTDARGCELLVEDVYVENANNCSPDHPQRFTMQVVDAVSVACDDGTQQGEITVRLDFANNPPFSGVNYTFRLIRYTDSFNPFRRIGGEIVQEFTGITINTNGFQYTFVNVPMNEEGYAVTVSASGVNPPQHETCLYGTYAFINNAQVDLLPLPDAAFRLNYPLIKVGDAIEATVKDHVKGYSYQYDWNDGTTTTTSFGKSRHRFDTQGNYNITLTVTSDEGCVAQSTQTLRVFDFICESPVPDNGGSFFVDSKTGKIAFRRDECPGNFIFSCVSATAQPNIFDNTVAASATSYSDDWPLAPGDRAAYNFVQGANEFETGERGKWRTKNSYVFKAPLVETGKNYSAGTFQLEDFSWRYEEANNPSKWIRSSTVELYSVHGEAIQERNVLGIASAAKFGYDEALPYLTAQNAEYQDVYFESFERSYGNYLEDNIPARENGVTLTTEVVHAGARSARLDGTFQFNEIRLSDQFVNHGLMLKAWVWTGQPSQLNDLRLVILNTNGTDVSATPVTTVATIGGWTLVEAETHDFGALQVEDLRENSDIMVPALRYIGAGDIWIDDIRVQPSDAQMSAYVYNPANFRLLTVFDDQHFGLYYRYNAEGQLVRKQIETERGVKLIQETQYNTPRVSRME